MKKYNYHDYCTLYSEIRKSIERLLFESKNEDRNFINGFSQLEQHVKENLKKTRPDLAGDLLHELVCGDHSRKAVIKFFRDGVQFWNPGDVFGDDSRLWEPGEKEVRNPSIATALRRIAMCEQAGTGLRMIREEWKKLGRPTPVYQNDRSRKSFEFFLPETELVFPTQSENGEPYKSAYKSPYKSDDPVTPSESN